MVTLEVPDTDSWLSHAVREARGIPPRAPRPARRPRACRPTSSPSPAGVAEHGRGPRGGPVRAYGALPGRRSVRPRWSGPSPRRGPPRACRARGRRGSAWRGPVAVGGRAALTSTHRPARPCVGVDPSTPRERNPVTGPDHTGDNGPRALSHPRHHPGPPPRRHPRRGRRRAAARAADRARPAARPDRAREPAHRRGVGRRPARRRARRAPGAGRPAAAGPRGGRGRLGRRRLPAGRRAGRRRPAPFRAARRRGHRGRWPTATPPRRPSSSTTPSPCGAGPPSPTCPTAPPRRPAGRPAAWTRCAPATPPPSPSAGPSSRCPS